MHSRVGALDGIRGLALVAVLAYHAGPETFRGGFLGVEIFFVLSGYLLTSSLLDEHLRSGRIDHRAYAARRFRRLAPAGLFLLVALLFLGPVLAPEDAHRLRGDLLSSLGGLTNWHLIADGASYFDRLGRPPFVRHLWSLSIEIQFCIVLSLAVAWAARRSRRSTVAMLSTLIAAGAVIMGLLYRAPDPSRAYYGTDTRLGALFAGTLLAVVCAGRLYERFAHSARWLAAPALAGLGLLFVVADERARMLYPAGFLVTQIATAVLIVAAITHGRWAAGFGSRPLTWLGRRSYGIYLWHWPIVLLTRSGEDVPWPPLVAAAASMSTAVALGALSYRFVEAPLMRGAEIRPPVVLRQSMRARLVAGAAAIAMLAALVGLGLRLPTTDPIAASLRAGEEVLAVQAVPTPAPSLEVLTPSAAPEQPASRPSVERRAPVAAPLPPPVLAAFRPGSVSVTTVGDSVMVGAAGALHEKLGSSGYIDAKKNRRFSEAADIVRALRDQSRLGRVLIVHLGNNGPVKDEEVNALIRQAKRVDHVLLVTVRVNKAWGGHVNEVIRSAARRYKQIRVVDWYSYSEGHSDWFWSDGTHLRRAGADAYAKLLTGSIPKPEPTPTPRPKATPTPNPIPLPTLPPPPN